jgi:CheY-like chemotaxis protein
LVALLSSDGHLTIEASDGLDGLIVARAERPDVVISDIMMPTIDGFGLVRALREDPELSATRVIFCTANYNEQETKTLARACQVGFVLMKPCEPVVILKAVEQVLAGVPESAASPSEQFDQEH